MSSRGFEGRMTLQYLGPDPLDDEITALLVRVAAGEAPKDLESKRVDVKEEAGRRLPGGAVAPGAAQNRLAVLPLRRRPPGSRR